MSSCENARKKGGVGYLAGR